MPARQIVITIAAGGDRGERAIEGLRAAVGLLRGLDGHQVRVILRQEGVLWATASQVEKHPDVAAMLHHLRAAGAAPFVEAAALSDRKLKSADLVAELPVIETADVDKILGEAEAQLSY